MELWTPAQISTRLWLDAADESTVTLVDGVVSQWDDKSGNGRHAAQSTASLRPGTGTRSSLQTVAWGSAENAKRLYRAETSFQFGAVFVAANWSGGSTFSNYCGLFTSSSSTGTPNAYPLLGESGSANLYVNSAYFNGNDTISQAATTTLNPGIVAIETAFTTNGFSIGFDRSGSGNRGWRGDIFEIVLLATADATLRKIIEGYLAHKWGLTGNLPAGHPYIEDPPYIYTVSGVITGSDGNPCQRKVYAVTRPTDSTAPQILAHGLSDATTGEYSLTILGGGEVTRVVVSEDDDPLLNDLVARVLPG